MKLFYDLEADNLLEGVTKIHCVVAIDADTNNVYVFHDHKEPAKSGTVMDGVNFLNSADELIAHNQLGYDAPVIKKVTGVSLKPTLVDTLIMSRLLNPDRDMLKGVKQGPHSIEAWGVRLGHSKPEHEDWTTFTPEMLHRCVEDTRILQKVYDALLVEAGDWDWSRSLRIEHKIAEIMMEAEIHGWPFDKEKAEVHLKTLETTMDTIDKGIRHKLPMTCKPKEGKKQQVLTDAAGTQFETEYNFVSKPFLKTGKPGKQVKDWYPEDNSVVWGQFCRIEWHEMNLASDKQVKKFLLSIGWKPTEWNINTKTGEVTSPKLTEDSLDLLKNPIGKKIGLWLKAKQRHGILAGWVRDQREDGRLPSKVTTMGTPTGRMTHKIIANVPSIEKQSFFAKEMREVFIAEPGYKIVGADASSCQLRKLCHYMGDESYTFAVVNGNKEDGTDVHSLTQKAVSLPSRGVAKNFIYGFLFGAQAAKLGTITGQGKAAGKRYMEQFMASFPKLQELLDGIEAAWKKRGYLVGLDGRKIFVRKRHELLCYLLQCAEAVFMKVATIIIVEWVKQERLDARLVCVYHDELSFMVREDHAQRVAYLIEQGLIEAGKVLNLTVPTGGEAAIGDNWAEVH